MTDFISREAVLDRIIGYDFQHCPDYMEDWATELKHAVICDLKDAVETLPAADVAPVVHGRWIKKDILHCSECDMPTIRPWPYCQNCGAKMQEVK